MRTILTIWAASAIWCCAQAADQYVYVREGAVACQPRDLPSVGVRLDTGDVVLGLHGADPAMRAACGWLPVVRDPAPADGMRIASQDWVVEDGTARLVRTYEPIPPTPYRVSKLALIEVLDASDLLPAFVEWLDSDPAVKIRWDAAVVLTSEATIPMVQAALATLPEALGITMDQIDALVQSAAEAGQ